MTLKKFRLKKIDHNWYAQIIICRVVSCKRAILPKIEGPMAIYPERCPGCRNKYYNEPYTQKEML